MKLEPPPLAAAAPSPTPAKPRTLYRYYDIDGAWKTFASRKARLKSPVEFNDPFDCQWIPYGELRTAEFRDQARRRAHTLLVGEVDWGQVSDRKWRGTLGGIRTEYWSSPPETRDALVEGLVDIDRDDGRLLREYAVGLRALARTLRLLCLTEHRASLLLWSHYAQHHRGVVVEFDVGALERAWPGTAEKVQYADAFPTLADPDEWAEAIVYGRGPEVDVDRVTAAWTLTKADPWKYEGEWRFVGGTPEGDPGTYTDLPIPDGAVVSLTAGCRTDQSHFDAIVHLARPWNPKLTTARLEMHGTEFKLVEASEASNPAGGGR